MPSRRFDGFLKYLFGFATKDSARAGIDESKARQTLQEAGVRAEVRLEVREMTDSGVDVGQRRDRLKLPSGVNEYRELIDKVANSIGNTIRTLICLSRHLLRTDLKAFLKVLDLVGLTFQIIKFEVAKDEVQAREFCFDVVEGVGPAIPKIFSADCRVKRPEGQLIDPCIVLMLALLRCPFDSARLMNALTVRPDWLPLNCRTWFCVK